MPAAAWFRFELRNFVRETLLARSSACRNYFDAKAIETIVDRQEEGKLSGFQEVWSLLVFEFWHKEFIEGFIPAGTEERPSVKLDLIAGRGA